jgi:hypothetical protein
MRGVFHVVIKNKRAVMKGSFSIIKKTEKIIPQEIITCRWLLSPSLVLRQARTRYQINTSLPPSPLVPQCCLCHTIPVSLIYCQNSSSMGLPNSLHFSLSKKPTQDLRPLLSLSKPPVTNPTHQPFIFLSSLPPIHSLSISHRR